MKEYDSFRDSTSTQYKSTRCEECDLDVDNEQGMKMHMRKTHDIENKTCTKNSTKCDDCEFNAVCESDLKIHMREKHEIECNACNEKFAGLRKLKNHMCRIHVVNPSSGDYYMKNWYLNNDCISVFSKQQQREVALIHSIFIFLYLY